MNGILRSAALGMVVAFGSVTSAFGAAGTIITTVTPLTSPVSYSDGGKFNPMIGYEVSVRSDSANTINNIAFTADSGDPANPSDALPAVYVPVTGTNCTPTNAAGTAIRCPIGQLKAGVSAPTFYVFFSAPQNSDGGVHNVYLKTRTLYAEQTNDSPNSPNNSIEVLDAAPVELGTPSPKNIKSAVPKSFNSALTFFTASNTAGDLNDQISTFVTIPANAPIATTLEVNEDALAANDTACVAAGNFNRCYASTISIPNLEFKNADGSSTGQYLLFQLVIDSAAIKNGLNTSKVRVYYDGGVIGACVVNSASGAATVTYTALPCVDGIVYYKNKSVLGWTPENNGTLAITIRNDENGRITIL